MLLEQQNQSSIRDQLNERELEFKIYQLESELQNKDQERLLVEQQLDHHSTAIRHLESEKKFYKERYESE